MTHGHACRGKRSPTYNSFRAMRERCTYPSHPYWSDYGGRGITVYPAWLGCDGFTHFLAYMGERPAGHTLERMDVDGDYEPGNVRWATVYEQRWNRRDMVGRRAMELDYA